MTPAKLIALCAVLSLFAGTAEARRERPLLLKRPFPAGLRLPQLHAPTPFAVRMPDSVTAGPPRHLVVCYAMTIDRRGHVSNVELFRSSGNAEFDSFEMEYIGQQTYEPATIRGVPIAVRMIAGSVAIGGPGTIPTDAYKDCD